jgi:hypothetical protein
MMRKTAHRLGTRFEIALLVRPFSSGSHYRNSQPRPVHVADDGGVRLASGKHRLCRRNALARTAKPKHCQLPVIAMTVSPSLLETRARGVSMPTVCFMEKRSDDNDEQEITFDEDQARWFISLMYDFYWEEWGDDERA